MGLMDTLDLEEIALVAYGRLIGLEFSEVSVDGCITKAPCAGQKSGPSPVDRGKGGMKRSTMVDANGIPFCGAHRARQPSRLAAFGSHPRCRSGSSVRVARACERPPRPRLRLEDDSKVTRRLL